MKMKLEAPSVYRWTERMNACDDDMPEFPGCTREFPAADEVPPTLVPVLRSMARDFLPELLAIVAATDVWLDEHGEVALGTPCTPAAAQRWVTNTSFELRGATVTTIVPFYTLYMLQRVTDAFAALGSGARVVVERLFDEAGLAPLLTLKARRRVERRDHIEIWGDVTGRTDEGRGSGREGS